MEMWGGDGDVKKCLICPSVGYILDHVESGHFSGYLPGFLDQKKRHIQRLTTKQIMTQHIRE